MDRQPFKPLQFNIKKPCSFFKLKEGIINFKPFFKDKYSTNWKKENTNNFCTYKKHDFTLDPDRLHKNHKDL